MRIVNRVDVPAKAVALTFDDGPTEALSGLLDLLSQHDARATFFWGGLPSDDLQRRVRAYGHELGSHGRGHLHPGDYQDSQLKADMLWSYRALHYPTLYRPPFGEDPVRMGRIAASLDMDTTVMWDVDSEDYLQDGKSDERVLARVRPGSIVLLHEEFWPNYLSRLLDGLNKSGYRLVTVSQLLVLSEQSPPH